MKLDPGGILKIGMVISLLIISASIFYYFVIFLPKKENQKLELQRQESQQKLLDETNRERQIKANKEKLDECLVDVDISYSNNWNSECKSQGLLSKACIHLSEIDSDIYFKENNFTDDQKLIATLEFFKKKSDCSCRLSFDNSDRIEGWKKSDQDQCYRKYQTN